GHVPAAAPRSGYILVANVRKGPRQLLARPEPGPHTAGGITRSPLHVMPGTRPGMTWQGLVTTAKKFQSDPFIPERSITGAQDSISDFTLSRNCSGESNSGVTPCTRSRSRVSAASTACRNKSLMRATSAGGVVPGANTPNHGTYS